MPICISRIHWPIITPRRPPNPQLLRRSYGFPTSALRQNLDRMRRDVCLLVNITCRSLSAGDEGALRQPCVSYEGQSPKVIPVVISVFLTLHGCSRAEGRTAQPHPMLQVKRGAGRHPFRLRSCSLNVNAQVSLDLSGHFLRSIAKW